MIPAVEAAAREDCNLFFGLRQLHIAAVRNGVRASKGFILAVFKRQETLLMQLFPKLDQMLFVILDFLVIVSDHAPCSRDGVAVLWRMAVFWPTRVLLELEDSIFMMFDGGQQRFDAVDVVLVPVVVDQEVVVVYNCFVLLCRWSVSPSKVRYAR